MRLEAHGPQGGAARGQRQLNRSHFEGAHATYAEQRERIQRAVGNYSFYIYEGGAFEAITTALSQGKSLGECLLAAETAEASRSVEEQAAAAAAAEARATETPQERAAREREEMAARGKF